MKDTGEQLPEAHVLTVVVVEGPENLYRTLEPSAGTVIVIVHEGIVEIVCGLPSKLILEGFTSHPDIAPELVGPPLATEIVV